MTLIMTVNGRESIWLLADRRLSIKGRAPKDDARKLMFLETTDGVAIIGYAGLGATALGSEPSDWMSAALRGRNLPLEQCLGVLAQALERQFPRHMFRMAVESVPSHHMLITAFVGDETKFYTIDLVFAPDRKSYYFRYAQHFIHKINEPRSPTTFPPLVCLGGAGAKYLIQDKRWMRKLLRLLRAYNRSKISPFVVANYMAALNYKVHSIDKLVGPRCIVAWRNRKKGVHKGGGAHRFYFGTSLDVSSSTIPTICNGIDLNAVIAVTKPYIIKWFKEILEDNEKNYPPDNLREVLNEKIALLPNEPDEDLR